MTTTVPRQRRRPGPPSKGERRLLGTRVPLDLVERVHAEAAAAGLSVSELLAGVIAQRYRQEETRAS